ncbi:MAG: helix-turn-helix transcriptional regulator [Pseudomonadota bacterium]
MRVRPVPVSLEAGGLAVFESRHAPNFAMEIGSWPFEKLCLVRQGQGVLRLEEGDQTLIGGDLLRIPAGIPHAFADQPSQPMTLTMACYDERIGAGNEQSERILARYRESLPPQRPYSLNGPHRKSQISRRFRDLVFENARDNEATHDAIWCGLVDLMRHITSVIVEDDRLRGLDPSHQSFASSLAHLDANFVHPVRVDELAAIANLSYRRYTEVFRKHTGATVVEYVTHLRLEFAKQRLLETGNIMLSCLDAGFGDLSSFYRAFNRFEGTTPKRFLEGRPKASAA